MAQTETGIRVKTTFFFLSFILLFFKPTVVIDGNPQKVGWGERFFPTTAGVHNVEIFFRYLIISKAGRAETTVTVPEGRSVFLKYRAPWILILPGKIRTAQS